MSRKARKQSTKRRPGRPAGSANIPRPIVPAVPVHCPNAACGSSLYRRTPGYPPTVMEHSGVSKVTGQPYRFIVWANVQCKACGQHFKLRLETNDDPREQQRVMGLKDEDVPW
jgi:hypothetical protein